MPYRPLDPAIFGRVRLGSEKAWERFLVEGSERDWDRPEGWAWRPGLEPGDPLPWDARSAPGFFRLVDLVKRRFQVKATVTLYQQRNLYFGHAWGTVDRGDDVALHLFAPALSMLGGRGLAALVGHELGHALVHHARRCPAPPRLVEMAPKTTKEAIALTVPYAYAAELTADRFGLLAAMDLDGALRLDFVLGTGLDPQSVGFEPTTYLRECEQMMTALLRAEQPAGGTTHPEHALRAFALGRFWRTRFFREQTGRGPGDLDLAEVDRQLLKLLIPGWLSRGALEMPSGPPSHPSAREAPAPVPTSSWPARREVEVEAQREERARSGAARWWVESPRSPASATLPRAPWDALGTVEERLARVEEAIARDGEPT